MHTTMVVLIPLLPLAGAVLNGVLAARRHERGAPALACVLAAGSLALPACNTTIGMSRDIRALGVGMENVAQGRRFDGNYPSNSTTQPSHQRSSVRLGRP